MQPYIWVIGLYPSPIDREWTIIKASVPDVFCSSKKGNSYPRLSDWAMETSSEAFLYHVKEEKYHILLEATEYGEILVSGYIDRFVDKNMMFYNEPVIENHHEQFFLLLDVPEKFQMVGKEININEEERQRFNFRLEKIDRENPNAVNMFIPKDRRSNMTTAKMDKDLYHLFCDRESYWFTNDLLYDSYTKLEEFTSFGVKLLYFQVGAFELNTTSGEIWKAIDFSSSRYYTDLKKVNISLS